MKQDDIFDIAGRSEGVPADEAKASEKDKKTEAAGDTAEASGENTEELSFEEAIQRLEKTARELQRSDLSLDRSMELFKEGTVLLAFCRRHLDQAEQEVKALLEKA